jgi:Transglutaminase-like superfamily
MEAISNPLCSLTFLPPVVRSVLPMSQKIEREFQRYLQARNRRRKFKAVRDWWESGRRRFWGFLLLALVLFYQFAPEAIENPFNDLWTSWRYQAKPAIADSPWPWTKQPASHPLVAKISPDGEKSIELVAKYISQQETDPYLRVKAIHDYVLGRLDYDVNSLKTGVRPAQDARSVFASRKAVCEGYANLFMALGKTMGIEVAFVGGNIRKELVPTNLISESVRLSRPNSDWTLHAWNTVKVKENWYIVDTTWDDRTANTAYHADYLMLKPEAMIPSHLPERQAWQLLEKPINAKMFAQQPLLEPQFFAKQLKLLTPQTYQTTVEKIATLQIVVPVDSPGNVIASYFSAIDSNQSTWYFPFIGSPAKIQKPTEGLCESQAKPQGIVEISCRFPQLGYYEVAIFGIEKQDLGKLQDLGRLRFQVVAART